MPRKNKFQTHPRGAEVEAKLLKGEINKTEAARILGCSIANVSQLTSKWPMFQAKKEKPSALPSELSQLEGLGKFTMEVDTETPMEVLGPLSWRAIWQGLLMMSQRDLEPDQYTKLASTLIRMMQFQFAKEVPEIKEKPLALDRETEDRLIKRIGSYCEQCPYRRDFVERKAKSQSRARLESEQSSSVG